MAMGPQEVVIVSLVQLVVAVRLLWVRTMMGG